MQDNKRTLYFMGGTVLAGLLLVVGMYIFDYIQKPKTEGGGGITLTGTDNHKELQRKIDSLTIDEIEPKVYNSLYTEITTSFQNGNFKEINEKNLLTSLQEKYEELSFIKADRIIARDPITEDALNSILSHLSSIGANSNRINLYKKKLQQIKYYTVILPNKVNQFTSLSFDDFNANNYNSLKSELENLPNLDNSLKNRTSIISARNNCLNRIKNYNSEYLDYLDAMNVSN